MLSTGPRGQAVTGLRDEMKTLIVAAGVIIEQGKDPRHPEKGGFPSRTSLGISRRKGEGRGRAEGGLAKGA